MIKSDDGLESCGLPADVANLLALPIPLKRVDDGLPGLRFCHLGRMYPQKTHMNATKTIIRTNMIVKVLLEPEARRSRSRRGNGGIVEDWSSLYRESWFVDSLPRGAD